ncbi:MAG TPA: rod shape-determining protein MreC [Myxococcales bacterium]|nr:rod shape-determining protein MreC [Myxococcales bacterium]
MLSLIKRYRDLILVAGLLLLPFFTFVTRGPNGREPYLVDRWVLALSSHVQRAFAWALDGTASVWTGYAALRGVEAENRGLRAENQALRAKAMEQDELRAENERLRSLVAYADKKQGQEVVAKVVGVDPSSTRHFVRIDRGESDGVAPGMAVITPDGVAGYVERATSGWADVILITDATHRMGVRDERTRARAIAAGTGGKADLELRLDYALRKDDLAENDAIITSGTDGVYPAGLRVGTLSRVEQRGSGMFRAGSIHPAVDPTKLEEVLVLPKVAVPLPAPPAKEPPQGAGAPGTGGAGVPP